MIDITLIPAEVKHIAQKWAKVTKQIQTDLETTGAKAIAAYFGPEGTAILAGADTLCTIAIKDCNAIIKAMDSPTVQKDIRGVQARLQALGADLTKLEHDSQKHTVGYYVICFEAIFRDLFGSPNNAL